MNEIYEFKNLGIEFENMNLEDEKCLENILANKNNEISNFIKSDLDNFNNNCIVKGFYIYKEDDSKFGLNITVKNLGGIDPNFSAEQIIFYFDHNGKIIKGFTYSSTGNWEVVISEFQDKKLHFSFLKWLGERCNLAYEIFYCGINNFSEDYKNKKYDNFTIMVEMNTENGCKSPYRDIQKLYDEFTSGNFDLNKIVK